MSEARSNRTSVAWSTSVTRSSGCIFRSTSTASTRRSGGWPSTSCWRCRWAWSRDQRQRQPRAAADVRPGRAFATYIASVEAVIGEQVAARARAGQEIEARRGRFAHFRSDRRARRCAGGPGRRAADDAAAPGRRRLGQDGRRGARTRVRGRRRPPGALLAPTDLLARQHAQTLRLLEPLGHDVTLLTGSLPAAQRREALELLGAPRHRSGRAVARRSSSSGPTRSSRKPSRSPTCASSWSTSSIASASPSARR